MRIRSLIVVGLLLTLAASAEAQDRPANAVVPAIGSRVRITSAGTQSRIEGLIVALDRQAVTVAANGGGVTIELGSITSVEMILGRKRNGRKGLLIGLLVGVAAALAPTQVDPNTGLKRPITCIDGEECGRGQVAAEAMTVMGLTGAGIGALIKTDRWGTVTFGAATPPSPAHGRALGLTATFRF